MIIRPRISKDCAQCHRAFSHRILPGRQPIYCSGRCRTYACRARAAAELLPCGCPRSEHVATCREWGTP